MRIVKQVVFFVTIFSFLFLICSCSVSDIFDGMEKLDNAVFKFKTDLIYEADVTAGIDNDLLAENMESAKITFEKRLKDVASKGYSVDIIDDTCISVSVKSSDDIEKIDELLRKTAVIEFRDADGNVGITGNDIKSAECVYGKYEQNAEHQYYVNIVFKPEAIYRFAEMTKKAAGRSADGTNYVAIYMDDVLQSSPFVGAEYVETGINTEEVTITVGEGGGALGETQEEYAKNLANIINSGCLPFRFTRIK